MKVYSEVIRTKDAGGATYINPPVISRHRRLVNALKQMYRLGPEQHRIVYHSYGRKYYFQWFESDGRIIFTGERGEIITFVIVQYGPDGKEIWPDSGPVIR